MIAVFSNMSLQLVPLLLLFLCSSCGTAPVSSTKGATIYYVGTQEYARKVEVMKLSPEDARKLVVKQISNEGQSAGKLQSPYGSHQLIIADCYHFFMKQKTDGIPLTGYYVDGNTGKVEFRKVEGSVSYPKQK